MRTSLKCLVSQTEKISDKFLALDSRVLQWNVVSWPSKTRHDKGVGLFRVPVTDEAIHTYE